MYSRDIGGEEYTFGVSGKLIMNTLVMYDRQTESLWGQLLGEAIEGPLLGTQLEFVPAIHTTWEDWRTTHPETDALVKNFSGNYDPYLDYYYSQRPGVIGRTNADDTLGIKEFVVGVFLEDDAMAYPFNVLNEQPVVNDEVGGTPVVVAFNSNTGASAVYERDVDGETLTFAHAGELKMTDEETGSTWNMMTGLATAGPLAGTQLMAVKSTNIFWFGWVDWYPDTRVYGEIYNPVS